MRRTKSVLGMLLIAIVGLTVTAAGESPPEPSAGSLNLPNLEVLSGDTLELKGESIRIKGVQTPQPEDKTMRGGGKCMAEELLGNLAHDFVAKTVATAIVQIDRETETSEMKSIATVYVNEQNLAELVIQKGYGVPDTAESVKWCQPQK